MFQKDTCQKPVKQVAVKLHLQGKIISKVRYYDKLVILAEANVVKFLFNKPLL